MSLRSNCTITLDLLSNASACVRTLRTGLASPLEQVNLDLAIGAVYCLEQQDAMSSDLTDTVFSERSSEALSRLNEDGRLRWMASQVEYGKINSRFARPDAKRSDGQDYTEMLEGNLRIWKPSLPEQYQDIDQPYPRNFASDSRKLWIFCQYHEAILYLYDGQENNEFGVMDENMAPTFRSARIVLEATSILPPSVVLSNR